MKNRTIPARIQLTAGLAVFLCSFCLAVTTSAQEAKPTPNPTPQPTPRRPLPKLSNGARGFESRGKDSSVRLIAIGGGYGAGEEEEPPLPRLKRKTALGYYQWGLALSNRAAMNEAIGALEQAVKLNPSLVVAYWKLGNVYAEYNNLVDRDQSKFDDQECYRRAIAAFEQVRLRQPRRAGVYNNLGVLYFNTAQYEKAIAAFQTGLSLKPRAGQNDCSLMEMGTLEDGDIYFFLAVAYQKLDRDKPALELYQRASRAAEGIFANRIDEHMGLLYEKLGETDKAIAAYKAIDLTNGFYVQDGSDKSADIHLRLGLLYASKQSFEQAVSHFNEAGRHFAELLRNHSQNVPEPEYGAELKAEWEEEMRRIIDGVASAQYNLGVTYLILDQAEKAVEALGRSIEANPQNPEALFNLGFAYLSLNNKSAAREQARALRKLDPEMAADLEQLISK